MAARDAALLEAAAAEQRARDAEARADEAASVAADAMAAGEDRNRRFALLQGSFKETEAALREKCDRLEKAHAQAANTPSAEMALAVGEAIEEAEAATEEARREAQELRQELAAAQRIVAETETAAETARGEAVQARQRAAAAEEMAEARKTRPATERAEAEARSAKAEAAAARAAVAKAEMEIASLTKAARAKEETLQGSASNVATFDTDAEMTKRLASAVARIAGKTGTSETTEENEGSMWSWAFGGSPEEGTQGPGTPPSLEQIVADLERVVETNASASNETVDSVAFASARRDAADATTRAETAERALAELKPRESGSSETSSTSAQTAQAKRVAAAEGFAAELAGKLETSEKRVSELQWQVRMLADTNELGAGDATAPFEPAKGPAGWLAGAVKGCIAPRPGRGR